MSNGKGADRQTARIRPKTCSVASAPYRLSLCKMHALLVQPSGSATIKLTFLYSQWPRNGGRGEGGTPHFFTSLTNGIPIFRTCYRQRFRRPSTVWGSGTNRFFLLLSGGNFFRENSLLAIDFPGRKSLASRYSVLLLMTREWRAKLITPPPPPPPSVDRGLAHTFRGPCVQYCRLSIVWPCVLCLLPLYLTCCRRINGLLLRNA